MKWLVQSLKLQLSVICANLYPNKDADMTLVNLIILGNIFFVLLHPESASFGILGVLMAWKFYKTGKLTRF
jgi:hypothetical protein